jgi:hypothetical protein
MRGAFSVVHCSHKPLDTPSHCSYTVAMANYTQVQEALTAGTSPADLCRTCPWDRLCITPPEMSRAEIERKMKESEDLLKAPKPDGTKDNGVGQIVGSLMTSMLYNGKDTQAQVCPVLVVRMKSSEGRSVVDGVRAQMKAWDDDKVDAGA